MKKTNRVLALLLAMLMLLSTVLFTVTSCDDGSGEGTGEGTGDGTDDGKDDGKDDGTGGGKDDGKGDGKGDEVEDVTYTVNVSTKGGMKMVGIPVYVWSIVDGELDDIAGSTTTDENGKATFSLNPTGTYSVQIDEIPDGYEVADLYPLVGDKLDIVLGSSLITDDTSLSGVVYKTGDIMKDFTIKTTEGTNFKLSEALAEKKAVLINFFYTSCGPCVTEFPYMQEAYEKYKDDLAIIAISWYGDDTESGVAAFKESLELTFDMAYTTNRTMVDAFSIMGYPTSVMIDRYGMISMIHAGAITYVEPFELMFKHFTAENYEQRLLESPDDLEERLLPDVEQPTSDEIGAAFEADDANTDITYYPEDDDEYSWPFIITEKNGVTCLKSTNTQNSSYSIMNAEVTLEAGQALAFDYFASTEKDADFLYVLADGKDIYSISGMSTDWETCYGFVAKESGTYTISFCYLKDYNKKDGEDTVYLSNLRIVEEEDIDSPTFIFRYAATGLDVFGSYTEYVDIFIGDDGYYHVGSATGPLLIADLMGYTLFSDEKSAYEMSLGKSYENAFVKYCNYASNSAILNKCPVTEDLKNLLVIIASENGADHDKSWLEFCCYYDAYGADGAELEDPIKGLAPFSAYDTIISTSDEPEGTKYYPNSVTYNRVIMPRGLFFKFTPTEETAGTYLIRSSSEYEVNAWIFKAESFDSKNAWITYDNVARGNGDTGNCYMLAYLEAGVDYYINIAFYDVYQVGTIDFRVERLGGEGYYRFSAASPGVFTYIENSDGSANKIIAGGIEVEYDAVNDRWYNKADPNSILYVDFTQATAIFTQDSIIKLINKGGFDFAYTEMDQTIVNILNNMDGDTAADRIAACDAYLRTDYWGEDYAENAALYSLSEIYAAYRGDAGAHYHGVGKSETDKKILAAFDTYYAQDKTYAEIVDILITELSTDWQALWGDTVFDTQDQLQQYINSQAETYIEEAYYGHYHGVGENMSETVKTYLDDIIYNCKNHDEHCIYINDGDEKTVCPHKDGNGDGHLDLDHICTCSGGDLNGCVIVDGALAEILQMLMDKYTFSGVENSWTKLCYYYEYFGPEAK